MSIWEWLNKRQTGWRAAAIILVAALAAFNVGLIVALWLTNR